MTKRNRTERGAAGSDPGSASNGPEQIEERASRLRSGIEPTERQRELIAQHEHLIEAFGPPRASARASMPPVERIADSELDQLVPDPDRDNGTPRDGDQAPTLRQLAARVGAPELTYALRPRQLLRLLAARWRQIENAGGGPIPVQHLIYAYMIENTRISEIFHRVLHEFLHGERLEVASVQGQQFIRTTEAVFYKDLPPADYGAVTSWIRPDIRASRRNAYYRMFGMELNHASGEDERPYEKAETANKEFMGTLEEFLREVWRAIENTTNVVAANPTDQAAIAALAEDLFDMLTTRRRNGNLLAEEFFYVSTMEWLHFAVDANSPIVVDLRSEATSPEERLKKVGERVGVPFEKRSRCYFLMAEPLGRILRQLETGDFHQFDAVPVFYLPDIGGRPNPVSGDIKTVVTQWGLATGRDLKTPRAAIVPRGGVPGMMNGPDGAPPQPQLPAVTGSVE